MSKKQKKSDKQLKHDRQISRDKRNLLRKGIKENVSLHRNNEVFHIMFISKETDNMEKILFDMFPINEGYLINLPIITTQMINEGEAKTLKELILHYFGIDADSVQLIEGTNLIVVKDFKVINNVNNLVELIVRPYNQYIWFNNNCIGTLYGERIYKGEKLKDFFVIRDNFERLFIFQDTITEILIYRMIENKINGKEFLNSYFANRKKRNNSGSWGTFYKLIAQDDENLREILINERKEIQELLSQDALKPKGRVLRLKD